MKAPKLIQKAPYDVNADAAERVPGSELPHPGRALGGSTEKQAMGEDQIQERLLADAGILKVQQNRGHPKGEQSEW
eukprot:CAMPEP_0206448934 /NCGR_PEP_ID=MMETSP0324_2-20121206/17788_1 /ASSEMBLY_ACC=CAM_ASM_000836 /TAXON_ID=2866 /ORGANISM="Crypthecodinium cohnii, Strain Seligo" /LENGTH=75 /DNA_ID=CAMNT_0053918213 /DNA_START=981 /DNA_END=1204 /DNA_ORIENTATION=-